MTLHVTYWGLEHKPAERYSYDSLPTYTKMKVDKIIIRWSYLFVHPKWNAIFNIIGHFGKYGIFLCALFSWNGDVWAFCNEADILNNPPNQYWLFLVTFCLFVVFIRVAIEIKSATDHMYFRIRLNAFGYPFWKFLVVVLLSHIRIVNTLIAYGYKVRNKKTIYQIFSNFIWIDSDFYFSDVQLFATRDQKYPYASRRSLGLM